jgi:ribose transport system ATP-binding protein
MRAGLALLPADRTTRAAIQSATVRENVTMPALNRYAPHGWLRRRHEAADVADVLRRFAVRPEDPGRTFATLSGGNQQKALLGRWLHTDPLVMLLDEPTQGVDVAACQAIFATLQQRAEAGGSVLYSSTDYEDLAHLCHRVLVFRGGRVAATLSGAALTSDRIIEQCYAARPVPA